MEEFEKRGYLEEDFHIFFLSETIEKEVTYHYHEFHKMILFKSGNVRYTIEGETYLCNAGDLIIIPMGTLHKVSIKENTSYDRIIVYMKTELINRFDTMFKVKMFFKEVEEKKSNVFHFEDRATNKLNEIMDTIQYETINKKVGFEWYIQTLLSEFLLIVNRAIVLKEAFILPKIKESSQIMKICNYINQNLFGDLAVDTIANELYISRYYLMHFFKEETGETIGTYISSKRLLYGRELIQSGMPVTEAAFACGFSDYSVFLRAFRKKYGITPKKSK